MTPDKIIYILGFIVTVDKVLDIFLKFKGRAETPVQKLEERIEKAEFEVSEIKHSLLQGNDRFREQDTMNEVIIRSVLALLEFEVHYCETEQKPISKNLEKAKDDLHDYFARKRRA